MKTTTKLLVLIAIAASAGSAGAGEWDLTGFIGADSQAFWQDARFDGQEDGVNLSLLLQPEAYWRSESGSSRF